MWKTESLNIYTCRHNLILNVIFNAMKNRIAAINKEKIW